MMNARGKKARGGRNKVMERQPSAEGVYSNHRFMQAAGALVGLPVQILTKTKEIFEGIFTTLGPEFDIVLDYPHLICSGDALLINNPEAIKRKLIFKSDDIVTMRATNVDFDYAFKDSFATDSAISKFNGRVQEKELEPWSGDSSSNDVDLSLEENANGWSADEMFRKNEEAYQVQTTYSPDMDGYTTPLLKKNTKEYKEQEARAQKLASEIEHTPLAQSRALLENGEDEEEKFSAVTRPDQNVGTSGKYQPPQRRKIQDRGNSNKQPRSSPAPQTTGGPSSGGSRYNNHNSNSSASYGNVSSQQNTSNAASSGSSYNNPSQMKHPPKSSSHGSSHDSKINGENKDSRRHDNYGNRENKSDNYHHGEMSHHHHPNYQQHTPNYHAPPPETRRSEPREQREPRKSRTNQKEESMAELKKFSQDFTLLSSTESDKKGHGSHFQGGHAMQHPPPQAAATSSQQQTAVPPPSHHRDQQHHRDHQTRDHQRDSQPREQSQREHQQNQHQHPPPSTKHHPPANHPPSHAPPPPAHDGASQQHHTPAPVPPPSPQLQSPQETSKHEEKVAVTTSKLNPNAKEFKPFSQSPATTPPRVQTPQVATAPAQAIPPMGVVPSAVSFPPNMPAYVLPAQQHRYQKRGGYVSVGAQRQDFSSQMTVAAATGTPILAHAPTALTPITAAQHMSTVPMPPNMIAAAQLGQAQQQYQYPSVPMLMRLPMVSMVPTSAAGMYHQGGEPLATSQQGHHLFMGPNHAGAMQPHPQTANPGGPHHPGAPPTPQNHNNAPIPNMPAQPPTQPAIMYSGGGQPTIPQHHVAQSVQHTGQSQYPPGGHGAAALASHHAQAPTTQFLMFPPHHLHQMIPQGMPPHSGAAGGHAPSSVGYSSATAGGGMQPMSHAQMHHFTMPGAPPGGHPNQ